MRSPSASEAVSWSRSAWASASRRSSSSTRSSGSGAGGGAAEGTSTALGGSAFGGSAFGGSAFGGSAFGGSAFGGSAFGGSGPGGWAETRSRSGPATPGAGRGTVTVPSDSHVWPPRPGASDPGTEKLSRHIPGPAPPRLGGSGIAGKRWRRPSESITSVT